MATGHESARVGRDLSGVVEGHALQERKGGHGVMYSSHIYPWKTDWKGKVLAATEKYPIFVGEVGCPPDWKGFEFIPPASRIQALGAWPPDVLGMIQKHRLPGPASASIRGVGRW